MNTFKIVLGCLLVIVLVSGSMVVAQEVDPPGEYGDFYLDAIEPDDSQELGIPPQAIDDDADGAQGESYRVVLDDEGNITYFPEPYTPSRNGVPSAEAFPLAPEMRGPAGPMPGADRPESLPGIGTDEAERIVDPVTGIIPIATEAHPVWEYHPAVAHGGNHYMVAYIKNSHLYVAVLNHSGTVLTRHKINDAYICNFPRIAYHAPSGLFLVTYQGWDWGTMTYDIWFAAVSPNTGLVGDNRGWSFPVEMSYPDVACNQAHTSCLVTYQQNINEIRGFYVTLDSGTGATWESLTTYALSNVLGTKPLIAWGKDSGNYLVVHTFEGGGGVKFPVFSHVLDLDPGFDPWTHIAVTVIDFTGWLNDKYPTGVTYDPCTEKFIVLFDHVTFFGPPPFVVDVWAAAVHKTGPANYWHGHVAYRWGEERGGGISFVTDDNLPAACGTMDKLVYTYTYTQTGEKSIYASDLRGNNNKTAPIYRRDGEFKHHRIDWFNLAFKDPHRPPAISSGSTKAELLVVYNVEWIASGNFDVWGAIVKVPEKNYLPLTVR